MLTGWLFATTHFVAARALRDEQRRRRREREAQAMNELMLEREAGPAWERLRPLLDEAILELDPLDRDAVLLLF